MAEIGRLLGYRDYDFVSPEGQRITGRSFFIQVNRGAAGVVGSEVATVSASSELMRTWVAEDLVNPEIGSMFEVMYNRRGKLAGFRRVDEERAALLLEVVGDQLVISSPG